MTELLTANQILDKMSARLKELVEKVIEHDSDRYYIRTTTGGFGYEGCAKNENVYDEIQAKEDAIEDQEWWQEDEEMTDLIKQLLWEL